MAKEKGTASPAVHDEKQTHLDTPSHDSQLGSSAEKAAEWENSPHHPRNWADSRRWKCAMCISFTGFLATCGSSIVVASADIYERDFGIKNEQVIVLVTALYVLGMGFGPFVFAPVSELYGRQLSYLISMTGYTAMHLGCAFAPDFSGLIAMRFLAGFFGSSGPGLGVATISDLFAPAERGFPISIYALGPMAGPVLGSLIGSYLVLDGDWRWPYRFMTIASGLNTLSIAFLMDETYSPVVRKEVEARGLVKVDKTLRSRFTPSQEVKDVFVRTITRPPRILLNPVAALFITYYSYIYSIIYVYLVSLPLLFTKHAVSTGLFSYNWPAGTAGLCYLGLGFGFLCSAATAAYGQDKIYHYLSTRYQDNGRPEYRLVITQFGMIFFPAGLLIWAWTAEAQTHWIGPLFGSAIFAYGLMMAFNSIQTWIVDAFFPYQAAAMAAAGFLRSVTGCILPIFGVTLFKNLGYGWGGTLLALISLPAVPAPFILFLYGKQLRERYKFEP